MFNISRHNWTQKDVDNAEIRKLNQKEPITMTGFYSILASFFVLLFFPRVKSEISHPAIVSQKRALHRQVTIAKIKKKTRTFASKNTFLKGPSKKLSGVSKKAAFKNMFGASRRKVLK